MWAGPGQRKERGRGGPVQGLGPTGVSGVSPRHKRPGAGGLLRCRHPWCRGGGHIPGSQPLIAPRTPAVCTRGRGLGRLLPIRLETRADEGARTRPGLPARPPAPLPGLPRGGRDPPPSRARSPGRAARGSAWRPRGARRRRVPSPWRPEEAAVCAARRTKRGAPLPAIVRPRPPAERAGTPGAGNTHPPARSPALTPGPKVPGSEGPSRTSSFLQGNSLDAGGRGPAADKRPRLDCGIPAPAQSRGRPTLLRPPSRPQRKRLGHRRSLPAERASRSLPPSPGDPRPRASARGTSSPSPEGAPLMLEAEKGGPDQGHIPLRVLRPPLPVQPRGHLSLL